MEKEKEIEIEIEKKIAKQTEKQMEKQIEKQIEEEVEIENEREIEIEKEKEIEKEDIPIYFFYRPPFDENNAPKDSNGNIDNKQEKKICLSIFVYLSIYLFS